MYLFICIIIVCNGVPAEYFLQKQPLFRNNVICILAVCLYLLALHLARLSPVLIGQTPLSIMMLFIVMNDVHQSPKQPSFISHMTFSYFQASQFYLEKVFLWTIFRQKRPQFLKYPLQRDIFCTNQDLQVSLGHVSIANNDKTHWSEHECNEYVRSEEHSDECRHDRETIRVHVRGT